MQVAFTALAVAGSAWFSSSCDTESAGLRSDVARQRDQLDNLGRSFALLHDAVAPLLKTSSSLAPDQGRQLQAASPTTARLRLHPDATLTGGPGMLEVNVTDGGVGINGPPSNGVALHSHGYTRIGPSTGNSRINLEPITTGDGFMRFAFHDLRFYDWDKGSDFVYFNDGGIGAGGPADTGHTLHSYGYTRIGPSTGNSRINLEPITTGDGFMRFAFHDLRFYDWDSGGDFVTFNNGNVVITGYVRAASFPTSSDARLKHILGEYSPGLDSISRLRPKVYRYRPGNARNLSTAEAHVGFVAQDVVEAGFGEHAASIDADGYYNLHSYAITAALVNAVHELKADRDAQADRLVAQHAETEKLCVQVERQRAELEQQRSEMEHQRSEIEHQRSEMEHQRSEMAQQRKAIEQLLARIETLENK